MRKEAAERPKGSSPKPSWAQVLRTPLRRKLKHPPLKLRKAKRMNEMIIGYGIAAMTMSFVIAYVVGIGSTADAVGSYFTMVGDEADDY